MRNENTATKTTRMALAAGLAILLAACGPALAQSSSDGDSPTSTTMVPTTTTTIPTPDPTTTTPTTPTTTPETNNDPIDQPGDTEVLVYFFGGPDDGYDCSAVTPVKRLVEPPMLLTEAIETLLAGPTSHEQDAGYESWFTGAGWTVESVTVSDGVARIDFSEDSQLIPNASTSCGSMALRAQLDSTATQFPTVDRAVYSIGGDLATFYHWLQADVPEV